MEASNGKHQGMATHVIDNMIVCTKSQQQEKKPRPQPEEALKCPRCDSINTKFCYYNNYSLSQPRYFCKSCRRYWTKGGTLRNVPVGGGCRKNRRSSLSSSKIRTNGQDHQLATTPDGNSFTALQSLACDSSDLSLAFARLQNQSNRLLWLDHVSILGDPINPNSEFLENHNIPGAFNALRNGFLDTQNTNFQNIYYGYGNGIGEVEGNGVYVSGEMVNVPYEEVNASTTGATTQAVTVTTMKQELLSNCGRDQEYHGSNDNNKVLWGYPWQLNGNGNMGTSSDLDLARESWFNGLNSSTWHGLLNSPLM